MEKVKFSVILGCWNYGMFLPDALDSLLSQTYFPDEILFINDNSTDNTEEVFTRYLPRLYERGADKGVDITTIRNHKRLGTVQVMNLSYGAMRGEYGVYLSADDTHHPEYYAHAIKVLDENPKVGVVYPDIKLFGIYNQIWDMGDNYREKMKEGNCISGSSVFRKQVFWDVDGFRETQMEDYDFWKRVIEKWDAYHIPKPYISWRRHEFGVRSEGNDIERRINYGKS